MVAMSTSGRLAAFALLLAAAFGGGAALGAVAGPEPEAEAPSETEHVEVHP